MKRVIAAVLAVAAIVALFLWWTNRGHRDRAPASGPTPVAATASAASGGAAAPVAPSPGRLEGWVRDAAGRPVAGAVVQIVDLGAPQAVGADGTFQIAEVEAGTHAVVAAAPGYLPVREADVAVVAGQITRVTFTLTGGGHSITGTVTDVSGGAIEGATVTAAHQRALGSGEVVAAALTDRDGRYRLTVAPGRYLIAGERDDYVRATGDLEVVDADRTLDLRLVPGGLVEGVVRDVATGAPVAGARVDAAGDRLGPLGEGRRRSAATTGADGRFRLAGLTPGALRLTAQVPLDGRQSREPVQVLLGIGEQVTTIELWVEAGPYLGGKVVDRAGAPIAEASVIALAAGSGESVKTDADGRFRVTGLAPGRYQVMANHARYAFAPPIGVELGAQPKTDLVIVLEASPRVIGQVTPPTEATITVDPERGPGGIGAMMFAMGDRIAGPDGRFEVSPITPGEHVIAAKAADGRRGQATVTVPAQGEVSVTIELADGASIAGTVRDQSGRPAPGLRVAMRRTSGAVVRRMIVNGVEISGDQALTASDGTYLMRGLEAGTYELAVQDERGGALAMRGRGGGPVQVRLGADEAKRGVDLSVELYDGVIRGVVTGPDGAPKADAWVNAVMRPEALVPQLAQRPDGGEQREMVSTVVMISEDDSGPGGAVAPVLTDEAGRFELRGLRRGQYDVIAEAERGAQRGRASNVATGASTSIRLAGLGVIAGAVTAGGAPADDFTVALDGPTPHAQRYRSGDGSFRIDRLEPGHYRISVTGPRGSGDAEVDVGLDRPAQVTIAVTADGKAIGRLLTDAGAPMVGVNVLAMPGTIDGHGQVTMNGPPETTDRDGRFSLTLAPGTYTLLALRPDGSPRTDTTFTVASGQTVDLGDVKLPPPGSPPPGSPPPGP